MQAQTLSRFLACVVLSLPSAAQTFTHACDGSAILYVGGGFFLNATDEDNTLRLYNLAKPGGPHAEFPMDAFLKTEPKNGGGFKEADIEAVARIGQRVYWIGSFGRDKKAKKEPSRRRLFATTLTGTGAQATLQPSGTLYEKLIDDLISANFEPSAALKAAEPNAHQKDGIDIEGMAATATGALLIGFRSPLAGGKAILATLNNPGKVTANSAKPDFGVMHLLDLGGLGIRDIISTGKPDEFFILAGDPNTKPNFAIYQWKPGGKLERMSVHLPIGAGAPEGMMLDDAGDLHLSSDSGDLGGPTACKDLDEVATRRFVLHKLSR